MFSIQPLNIVSNLLKSFPERTMLESDYTLNMKRIYNFVLIFKGQKKGKLIIILFLWKLTKASLVLISYWASPKNMLSLCYSIGDHFDAFVDNWVEYEIVSCQTSKTINFTKMKNVQINQTGQTSESIWVKVDWMRRVEFGEVRGRDTRVARWQLLGYQSYFS